MIEPIRGGSPPRNVGGEDPPAQAGPPRKLASLEGEIPSLIDQAVREEFIKTQEFVRNELSRLLSVFYWFNGSVIVLIFLIWAGDLAADWMTKPHDRVITQHVLMTLIGASAVQLGALAFAVGGRVLKLQDRLLDHVTPPDGNTPSSTTQGPARTAA